MPSHSWEESLTHDRIEIWVGTVRASVSISAQQTANIWLSKGLYQAVDDGSLQLQKPIKGIFDHAQFTESPGSRVRGDQWLKYKISLGEPVTWLVVWSAELIPKSLDGAPHNGRRSTSEGTGKQAELKLKGIECDVSRHEEV